MKDVNVPEGYKSTDISVIPKDWKEYYLTELGILERGKSKHRPRWAEHLYGGNYPFIQTGEVTAANKYITKYNKTYSEAGLAQSKLWAKGTLCITIAANIAETAILNFSACFPDSILGFVPSSKKANVEFVFYTINYLQERIKELAISSAQDNINLGTFQKLKLPLPPLSEQKAIARVLSDVDELIRECDSLLAKKRDIKQGTMQQLLTGKQRLPGFSGEWEIIKVNSITISHKQGFYTKEKYQDSGVSLVRITDLLNPKIDYASMPKLDISNKDFELFKINKGDFLIARSGAIGKYGIVYKQAYKAIFGSYIIRFFFNSKKIINEYFGYFYETEEVIKQLTTITQGSSNININADNIKSIEIPLPTLPEQKAIAEILSDMDAEIEALEQKRDKYKVIKQGMMQELLTGKTRLIDN